MGPIFHPFSVGPGLLLFRENQAQPTWPSQPVLSLVSLDLLFQLKTGLVQPSLAHLQPTLNTASVWLSYF